MAGVLLHGTGSSRFKSQLLVASTLDLRTKFNTVHVTATIVTHTPCVKIAKCSRSSYMVYPFVQEQAT